MTLLIPLLLALPHPVTQPKPEVSLSLCQSVLEEALVEKTSAFSVLETAITTSGLVGDDAKLQRSVCLVYLKGVSDGIALTLPRS